jgi:hypothetical protein
MISLALRTAVAGAGLLAILSATGLLQRSLP